MVQTDDTEMLDWAMTVNDKLEMKMDNPAFDVVAAMKVMALAYIKEKKVCSIQNHV